MREYIITVKDPAVWDTGLWNELTVDGLGDNFIPSRSIEVLNERPFNDFSAHFNITDEEAAEIRQDSRIAFVELQADLQEGVKKEHLGTRATATYDKSNLTANTMKNWGLLRSTRSTNPFASSTSVSSDFTYNLDGTGVDVIVVDSGVEPGHPEFAVNPDGTGGSRVVNFNWASLGVPGTPSASSIGGYLGDSDGHGSHCASVAAGNTQGWAPGAAIYSIRIFGGGSIIGAGYLGEISSDIAFDLVRAFHLAKRAAGNMRPTICTNSWGYRAGYSGMTSTRWRGATYSTTSPNSNYGQVYGNFPYVVNYLDISATNCANAGVILVGAAGNYRHKIDVPGGQDYDNYWTSTWGETIYYHRGSSPTRADGFINVGAIDNTTTEQKVYFSESGPRVDIYSPGTMIMGAYANDSYVTPAVRDPRNSSYFLNKISGTSMACPQVTGVLATVLQARPTMTPTEAKQFLIDHSVKNAIVEGSSTSYTSTTYLQGGNNRILRTPFTSPDRGGITS
jgi:subtilisin family serine protease